jgi:hypothetical protein
MCTGASQSGLALTALSDTLAMKAL